MRTADFQYDLPPELIAQHPVPNRDASRLLVVHRKAGTLEHKQFRNLKDYLRPGDILVVNNSKVLPARLFGRRMPSGGRFEILLLEPATEGAWWCLLKPGKRVSSGSILHFVDKLGRESSLTAVVLEKNAEGHCKLQFSGVPNFMQSLNSIGHLPLPPYIQRQLGEDQGVDADRYQTVYARPEGSVAAPTAGLHFTVDLLNQLRDQGIGVHELTLHVGAGTFQPVKSEQVTDHVMHAERYELPESTAHAIAQAKTNGHRVVAVGTTSLRVLESVARIPNATATQLPTGSGTTRLFLHPPSDFHVVDALLTNFHLPQSTLLMLVSAFMAPGEERGRDILLRAYREAVEMKYRFFSYGDAMLLV